MMFLAIRQHPFAGRYTDLQDQQRSGRSFRLLVRNGRLYHVGGYQCHLAQHRVGDGRRDELRPRPRF